MSNHYVPYELGWASLWSTAGLKGDMKAELQILKKAYSEPHRKYHTLDHIHHCMTELQAGINLTQDPVGVSIALLYHDFVYDPAASDNEAKSAEKAVEFCRRTGLTKSCGRNVRNLILSSSHKEYPIGCDAALVSDIDLAILGRTPVEFWYYERKIREEYDFVPEAAFREGRVKILRRFLDWPRVYSTEFFRNKYEAQARVNLKASIACLKGK